MSDLFRSALSNLSSNWNTTTSYNDQQSPGEHHDNEFVGQNIELNGQRLRVDKVIAEGK